MSDVLFDYFATRGFGKRRLSSQAASIVEAWHAEELLRFREDVSALMSSMMYQHNRRSNS